MDLKTIELSELVKMAEAGEVLAELELGNRFYYGEGGAELDLEKAVFWYGKSAEKECAEAQCLLGYCLREGIGTDADYEKAFALFEKAAEQGFAMAQYNLGLAFEKGLGVGSDSEKAQEWFALAKENGYTE